MKQVTYEEIVENDITWVYDENGKKAFVKNTDDIHRVKVVSGMYELEICLDPTCYHYQKVFKGE